MIAVTMGDANGVGPEIILKAYKNNELYGDFVIVGDYSALQAVNESLGYGIPLQSLNILDAGLLKMEHLTPGIISKEAAAASRQYIVTAAEMARRGECKAVVTLPVNKEAIRLTDPDFTGHTELIAGLCNQTSYTMMLAGDSLTVTHVSTHVSMDQAVKNIKRRAVLDVIKITNDTLKRFIKNPRIAAAGLNAHAGENGAFGRQELDEIKPAIQDAASLGINATGPHPPDTVFMRAVRGEFDAVVCMYHDQGHIPMKLLHFDDAVNVTLGLDIVRTSVCHGTAFDIAGKGVASTGSFAAAFNYAKRIS
jgi:4-hydroxythreonine-4-phosphate dehydrogenase